MKRIKRIKRIKNEFKVKDMAHNMHPGYISRDVKTLLYAGKSKHSKIHHFFINVGTIFRVRQSAGNIFIIIPFLLLYIKYIKNNNIIKYGTSETLRKEYHISIHRNIHKSILNISDDEFGYYLAGLIEGDGYFSLQNQIIITFNIKDASLAYLIKKRLTFGNIYKIKDKNAINLIISNKKGILKVLSLINGKLRFLNKLEQFNNLILKYKYTINTINLLDQSNLLDNFWFCGFSEADASFQIKIINRKTRKKPEIRLNFQIDQKTDYILLIIKNLFGGYIGFRKSQKSYYYGSTNFINANKLIKYFDKYHLQSTKYTSFIKWRKVYQFIQEKHHLKEKGINKIMNIKKNLNN